MNSYSQALQNFKINTLKNMGDNLHNKCREFVAMQTES